MEDRDAFQILSDRRGNMYDPQVVDVFFALHGHGMATRSAQSPALAAAVPELVRPPLEHAEEGRVELDLQTFFNLGRALGGATSISQFGEILWIHLRQHLPASAFVLYGYDEASDTIVGVYTAGDQVRGVHATRIPLGERLSGWVAASAESVMNSDARLDLDEAERPGSPLRSALAVPITWNGRPAGVLTFYAETSNAFDEAHRRLVEAASKAICGSVPGFGLDLGAPPSGDMSHSSTLVFQNTKLS
jgi:putative methionine-R-sulfoxide reductase with GAF domain